MKLSKSWFVVSRLQRQLLETDKQRVQAELKALKAQINPHFFFNTLNSIYSMSLDKDERLPGTVLQLSELMRYFLYEAREDLVLLSKEIHVLNDYIALQKIRSDEKLKVTLGRGPECRHRQEVRQSDRHQGRRHCREGSRARRRDREHGRADGERSGDQDLRSRGRRHHHGHRARPGDFS